jgi:hypothetical protein
MAGLSAKSNFCAVIPAQAGIQFLVSRFAAMCSWIPACAGMTAKTEAFVTVPFSRPSVATAANQRWLASNIPLEN